MYNAANTMRWVILCVWVVWACWPAAPSCMGQSDAAILDFALNLEYLETAFYSMAITGVSTEVGLDRFDSTLAASKAQSQTSNLDPLTKDIINQFYLQELGHIRAIKQATLDPFQEVSLNLSSTTFDKFMRAALGELSSTFDPYANSMNSLLASYLLSYVGLTGYVGAISQLQNTTTRNLVAGLLAVEAGQDAAIRTLLYERKDELVISMDNMTVAQITDKISDLRIKLGNAGIVDEGLDGVGETFSTGGLLAGDRNFVGYSRTPEQILSILYGTGDPSKPGGFFPHGASGSIAEQYLK